jgi:hypothetical protein
MKMKIVRAQTYEEVEERFNIFSEDHIVVSMSMFLDRETLVACILYKDGTPRPLPIQASPRLMYGVMGRGGGIHGFVESSWKAKQVRDQLFNIGREAPRRFKVYFEPIPYKEDIDTLAHT